MTKGERACAEARDWIGTPYRHQASCKGAGTDCLGLIRGIWRALYGEEPLRLPAYTADWSEASGREVLLDMARGLLVPAGVEPAIGDILIFRMRRGSVAKHLGVVSATGAAAQFIHAYSGHGVIETHLTLPWQRRVAARLALP